MKELEKIPVMESLDAINIVRNILKRVDTRLIDHGDRVAYILYKMLLESTEYSYQEMMDICVLGIFHDIGAYKTDEIDRMVQFETENILDHSIYGYLFFKYFTPMKVWAEIILYHHVDYDQYDKKVVCYHDISLLIHLADRIDVYLQNTGEDFDLAVLETQSGKNFAPDQLALFKRANAKYGIIDQLISGEYQKELLDLMKNFYFSSIEINQYLKMLIYAIDFRSVYTVTHTIETMAIAIAIATQLHYRVQDKVHLYYGALLHDVGKISIPLKILESVERLNEQEMAVMKTHVQETEDIIKGMINDEIYEIAIGHHEKMDGSGYPNGKMGEELNELQRIVAIADILSALTGKRSYKDSFPKEKVLAIIKDMQKSGQLCPKLCVLVITHYDTIVDSALQKCEAILSVYSNMMAEFQRLQKLFADGKGMLAVDVDL